MTDEELKNVVREYILNAFEADAADCLHEMDELSEEADLDRAYELFGSAVVTVSWEGE